MWVLMYSLCSLFGSVRFCCERDFVKELNLILCILTTLTLYFKSVFVLPNRIISHLYERTKSRTVVATLHRRPVHWGVDFLMKETP